MKNYTFKAVLLFVIILGLFAVLEVFRFHSHRRQNILLYNRIDELSKDKAAFREQFKLTQDMANPLKEGVVALKKSLEDKEKEESKLIKELNEKQAQMQNFKKELAESRAKIEYLNNELLLAKNDKANLVQKNSALDNSLQDMARELALTQEGLKRLQQSHSSIKPRVSPSSEGKIRTLKHQLTQTERKLFLQNKFIVYLKRNIDLLNGSVSEKEAEKGKLKSELTRIKVEEASQKARLTQQYKRLKGLEQDYEKQRLQLTQLKETFTRQTQELDNKNRELSTLKDDIFRLQSNLERLKRELAEKLESKSLESLEAQKEKTDKERAQELKRKIEVILESGNTN